ncbi:predicted protein [Coccidioides posadasii str. Silveira]|uniref:Predicted protein n=1 Tax=Coccidioides posadasii (strain RMSCC 757 / Silveira) TaxID=443226 RepID=E9D1E6_COCPS|nr:predicted protein [Coccidioides posadasii str. Silveira]
MTPKDAYSGLRGGLLPAPPHTNRIGFEWHGKVRSLVGGGGKMEEVKMAPTLTDGYDWLCLQRESPLDSEQNEYSYVGGCVRGRDGRGRLTVQRDEGRDGGVFFVLLQRPNEQRSRAKERT